MNSYISRSACLGLVVVLFLLVSPAEAQIGTIGPAGQSALTNSSAGAVAFRAPGNLVIAGVARLQQQTALAQAPIEITETTPAFSIRTQLLVDSINIIFDQLNQAISLFSNLLLARAGLPPNIPLPASVAG